MRAGMKPDEFLPRCGFQFAQGNDFFEEIAKIRAFRRIWAKTMHERFGAEDPRSMHVRIHTHTSGRVADRAAAARQLDPDDRFHALGAALAGTQAMEGVVVRRGLLAIPTEEAATLALRVQQVIAEETNVTAVADALGGSYYLESLTDQIADAALALVRDVEARGGYIAAQRSGWIRNEVERSAARWRTLVDSGARKVVGLNCYKAEREAPVPTFRVDPEVERIAVERDPRGSAPRATRAAGEARWPGSRPRRRSSRAATSPSSAMTRSCTRRSRLPGPTPRTARSWACSNERWAGPRRTSVDAMENAMNHRIRVLLSKLRPTTCRRSRRSLPRDRASRRWLRGDLHELPVAAGGRPDRAQESVDVIGVSSSSGRHLNEVIEDLMHGLDEAGAKDIVVIAGGVIPEGDAAEMKARGVSEVFGPGSRLDSVIAFLNASTAERRT